MKTVDFVTAQDQLAKLMRSACESDDPININGLGKDEVVVLSKSAYQELLNQQSLPVRAFSEPLLAKQIADS